MYLLLHQCTYTHHRIYSCTQSIYIRVTFNMQLKEKKTNAYWSLEGSLKSFQPSGATMSDINVYAKTTLEKGLHALPNHILPVPPMVHLTNAKPLSSSADALPCAVTTPFMLFCPTSNGGAIETSWQSYTCALFYMPS